LYNINSKGLRLENGVKKMLSVLYSKVSGRKQSADSSEPKRIAVSCKLRAQKPEVFICLKKY